MNTSSTTPNRSLNVPPSRASRYLCFDLENRPLAYWYDGQTTSEITAFGWKWSDEEDVQTMLLRRDGRYATWRDESLSARKAFACFAEVLQSADVVYGHNIRRHDLPIFQAHLLRHSLPPLEPLLTTDTCNDYPKRGGLSKSLENLAVMYDLGGEKFGMSQPAWEHANRLTPDGIALAHKRVVSDVLLQERLRAHISSILKPPRMWNP